MREPARINWLWTLIGMLVTAGVFLVLPLHHLDVTFVIAGFATAWGVASTRSNPAWGLLWGAGGACIGFAHSHFGQQLYDHEFLYGHAKLSSALIVVPITLLLGVLPTMAGPPRGRALLGALMGATVGAFMVVFLPDSAYQRVSELNDSYFVPIALLLNVTLLMAPLGALAVGGVRRRGPQALSAPAYGGQGGYNT
jgi:hypothetical protein